MSALILALIALLLWFIWKQLERIAGAIVGLHAIAAEKHYLDMGQRQ